MSERRAWRDLESVEDPFEGWQLPTAERAAADAERHAEIRRRINLLEEKRTAYLRLSPGEQRAELDRLRAHAPGWHRFSGMGAIEDDAGSGTGEAGAES